MFNGTVNGLRITAGGAGLLLTVLGAPVAVADTGDPVPAPPAVVADSALPAAPVSQADGVPHLPSPDNLPPGTTQEAPAHPTGSYLRDVWNALRSHDVTVGDALLLIAQRPMTATPAGMSPHPDQPASVVAVPAPDAAPAVEPTP